MEKTYHSNYLGLVVQNDDPEKRGRIKIWVPHVSAVVYDNWNKDAKDKNFVFPDKELDVDLDTILPVLKNILPWAECASPLFGGCASARYNAFTQHGTTSDTNYWEEDKQVEGFRPLQNYVGDNVYPDAFSASNEKKNRFVNPYAYQYSPSNYSNAARGMFTIPNVGSHVWVFFIDGNPNCPVYFAVSYGQEDWKGIYDSQVDSPETYENISKTENKDQQLDEDVKTFRAKTVYNSNKHTIELIDTDNKEILKLTHYSGSFKEFNNYANIELATNNDQKMVLGNQFLTVQKNQSIYVATNQEVIIAGDQYTTIGGAATQKIEDVIKILKELHEYKKLFDVQRAQVGEAPNDVSKYQQRNGTFAVCPVCKNIPYTPNLLPVQQTAIVMAGIYTYLWSLETPEGVEETLGSEFQSAIGQTGYYLGARCDVCNNNASGTNTPGYSPSTQDGTWTQDPNKISELQKMLAKRAQEIASLEKQLGEGDQIINIVKNKIETVGSIMNDMKSYRVDPIGKLRIDGVHVAVEDAYATFKPSPHVEYVDVDDVPGGDYNLTATNKYKLLVGAKGINIKTFGPIDMYGTIVNLVGEQINMSSQNEVFIDGGERFSIRARKVALIPFEHNPVVVEGQLHVTRNTVIGGGMFINGELGVNHITATYEYKDTELGGTSVTDLSMGPVPPHVHPIQPHTHLYKHIPVGEFLPSYDAVRNKMASLGVNSTTSIAAALPAGSYGSCGDEIYTSLVIPDQQRYISEKLNGIKFSKVLPSVVGCKVTENSDGIHREYSSTFNAVGLDGKFKPNAVTITTEVNMDVETPTGPSNGGAGPETVETWDNL